TFDGVLAPAAVTRRVTILPISFAQMITALQPARLSCELSPSILCAREIRRTATNAKAETPCFVHPSTRAGFEKAYISEINAAPFFICPISSGEGGLTFKTTSAVPQVALWPATTAPES